FLFAAAPAFAQDSAADSFPARLRPVLQRHCFACHSNATPKAKGDFRIDRLAPEFPEAAAVEARPSIAQRVRAGEMPPEDKDRLTEAEQRALLDWIDAGVKAAEVRRAAEGRVVLRRLNRVEYENTVRDLLGVNVPLQAMLPLDGSANGFDNVGEALHVSSF